MRDIDGALTYCSSAVWESLGYRPEELEGTYERDLVHPVDLAIRDGLIARLLDTNRAQPPVELRLRTRNHEWRWFETIDTLSLDNPDVRGIVTSARDITDRKIADAAFAERSLHDPLTGLPNWLLLIDRLRVALARTAAAGDMLAVLSWDLDSFRNVNDAFGHDGGDRVLIEVAQRCEQALRVVDTVARTGGDEFVAVCEGLTAVDDAIAVARHITDVVAQPFVFDDLEIVIAASIGIVTVPGSDACSADPATLVRNADAAMSLAKRDDNTRWLVFDECLASAATFRRDIEPELRRALVCDEFVLHYQPIYDLRDESIVGVEALLRWENPGRGLLAPIDFVGLAEETGLIDPIGTWVLETACAQVRRWELDLGWTGWMAVNVSAHQLAHPGLAIVIAETLTNSGLRADLLHLELTETALVRAGPSAAAELNAVRKLGVHIGLDDFGTGYASLTNLQKLPIDFLKIDRSFVVTLKRDGRRRRDNGNAIVEAVAKIGQTLDLETIAEGVETEEQACLLREFRCPYGQGFRFARPAPAAEIADLLVPSEHPDRADSASRNLATSANTNASRPASANGT